MKFVRWIAGLALFCIAPVGAVAQHTLTLLHEFAGDKGAPTHGSLLGLHGGLYGTTSGGVGTVYRLIPSVTGQSGWTFEILRTFKENAGGLEPQGGLIQYQSDALVGTTARGGSHDYGTVFLLSPPVPGEKQWQEEILHSFTYAGGAIPEFGVVEDSAGSLYGTTVAGNGATEYGTVFKLTPPAKGRDRGNWTYTVLYAFANGLDGGNPSGGLVFGAGGSLYGVTQEGGVYGRGTVYRLTPPVLGNTGWTQSVIWSFADGKSGNFPLGTLAINRNGVLYGTTYYGGVFNRGVVFKLAPPAVGRTAWHHTVLHAFHGSDGANPSQGVILGKDGALFGTCSVGGLLGRGVVFKLAQAISGKYYRAETLLSFFDSTNLFQPEQGLLLTSRGTLYGTAGGGQHNNGALFQIDR